MFRPAIQKLYILVLMAIFCILMTFISFNSQLDYQKPFYSQKVDASNYMFESLKILRSEYLSIPNQKYEDILGESFNDRNGNGLYDVGEEIINDKRSFSSLDPLQTGLVFYQDDLPGNPSSKLTTLNPSFAAFMVDLMIDAGIEVPDARSRQPNVAVALSSSFPGANLAVLSACKSMGIDPVIITSLSGSNYGALSYSDFSWLDIEEILIKNKIFSSSYRSKAVSIGRGGDSGIGLDSLIIKEIKGSIQKHKDIEFIYDERKTDLSYYVDKRMEIYDKRNDFAPYDLFINVGGGHASIGTIDDIRSSSGVLSLEFLDGVYRNNNDDCVMYRFSQSPNYLTPSINIIDIRNLVGEKLPLITLSNKNFNIDWENSKWISSDESNQLWRSKSNKSGILYIERKYNFWVVVPCLIASIVVVLYVGVYSHFQIKRRMTSYEPDSVS